MATNQNLNHEKEVKIKAKFMTKKVFVVSEVLYVQKRERECMMSCNLWLSAES